MGIGKVPEMRREKAAGGAGILGSRGIRGRVSWRDIGMEKGGRVGDGGRGGDGMVWRRRRKGGLGVGW